jgi:hypothetical protein
LKSLITVSIYSYGNLQLRTWQDIFGAKTADEKNAIGEKQKQNLKKNS